MSVSNELVWLINQLRSTKSARERLRLLALGWRTLKQLSPTDRLLVAKELGIDGGTQLVEQLSRRGGVSPSLLLGALRAAEDASPDDIRGVIDGLLDPNRRSDTVEEIAEEVLDWAIDQDRAEPTDESAPPTGTEEEVVRWAVDPDSGEPEGEPVPVPEPPPAEEYPELPGARSTTLRDALSAASVAAAAAGRELREDDEIEEAEVAPKGASPELGREPSDDEAVEEPSEIEVELPRPQTEAPQPPIETVAEGGGEEPTPEPPGAVIASRAEDDRGEPEEAAEAGLPADDPSAPDVIPEFELGTQKLVDRIAESDSLVKRLRELELAAAQAGDLSLSRLDGLLESFPSGWARRRAIEALIRAGVPERLDDALALIDRLELKSDRMWALTTLAVWRELSPDDIERFLGEADSPTLARRLSLRLAHTE